MEASSPVHRDVAFTAVKSSSTFHASTSTDAAEFEETIKHRAIISHIEAPLFFLVQLHVIRRYLFQKIDVLIGMELCHFEVGCGFGTLDDVRG